MFVRRFAENGWGENYWYLVDHLGTPRQLVDNAGASVWASSADTFGESGFSEANAFDNRLGFAGQYFDAETGSFYNYFRNYDPASGRYLQADPLGLFGGFNSYQYSRGQPTNYMDPYGLTPKGSTIVCAYYQLQASENPNSKYYPAAHNICMGGDWRVNAALEAGIYFGRKYGSIPEGRTDEEIYTRLRVRLVMYDMQMRKRGLIGPDGSVLGDCIDEYHNWAFAEEGVYPLFYGGNLTPQNVWPNPVPYDPRPNPPFRPNPDWFR